MTHDLESVAESYLRYFRGHASEDAWSHDFVLEAEMSSDYSLLWDITKVLLRKCGSDEDLALVAAGPFENLLKAHGVTEEIAAFCDADERMQLALSGVWLNAEYKGFERWNELMRKYGFLDGRQAL